jgi:hypothetical protein
MTNRMNADPLMVMQNMHVIEGRPSWSSKWIIACINGSGKRARCVASHKINKRHNAKPI